MAKILIVVDGGFKPEAPNRVQFAYKIHQQKNSIADFAYAPPGRINAGSATRTYEMTLGDKRNTRLASEVAELNAVVAALEAVFDIQNGYYNYQVEKTVVFVDSMDALADIELCRSGVVYWRDGSFADKCRVDLLQKIETLLRPSLTCFHVYFEKVDAHMTPGGWSVPAGMSSEEFETVMTMHAAVDGWVHAERYSARKKN